jgi:hypothetical protein
LRYCCFCDIVVVDAVDDDDIILESTRSGVIKQLTATVVVAIMLLQPFYSHWNVKREVEDDEDGELE